MVAYTASHPRTLGQQRALLTEVLFIIKEKDLFKPLSSTVKTLQQTCFTFRPCQQKKLVNLRFVEIL